MQSSNPVPDHIAAAREEDLSLARAAQRRDQAAVDRFAKRMECVPRILAVLNRRFGHALDKDQLADLTQDVLLLVWSKLNSYAGRATIENWVHGVCFHELRGRLRGKPRISPLTPEHAECLPHPGGETQVADYAFLVDGLKSLEGTTDEIVRLKHYEDLTFEQIGRMLDMPTNSVKSRYYRGLAKLRQKLAPTIEREAPQ